MRWSGRRQSTNIEDRRGSPARNVAGLGGVGLVIVIVYVLATGDLSVLDSRVGPGLQTLPTASPAQEAKYREFVGVTLGDTEEVWGSIFSKSGSQYQPPILVLYSGSVDSGCGFASAAAGPFYCPPDRKVYLDLSFFDQLGSQLGAQGDFAEAYVIAHEVGHHIQQLLGTMDRVQGSRGGQSGADSLSVRLELQADFYAGVWAHYEQSLAALDESDIREAMDAANAVGDDKLQRSGQGYVVPDSFTHGTSEQRVRWFMKGYRTGDLSQGDTFKANPL